MGLLKHVALNLFWGLFCSKLQAEFIQPQPLGFLCVQDALASYIVQREANGMAVLYWYHTAFIGVARRRYLSSATQRRHVHSTLAQYFLGSWGGGRKKPFQYSRKQLLYMSLKKNRQPSQRSRYYWLIICRSGIGTVENHGKKW